MMDLVCLLPRDFPKIPVQWRGINQPDGARKGDPSAKPGLLLDPRTMRHDRAARESSTKS